MSSLLRINSKLIVLTGGPGAGKTTVLEMAKHMFHEKAIVLHEAASMLYQGGFLRRQTPSAIRATQRAIFHIQREQERILEEEDPHTHIGLCDRGVLDGLAYWPGPKEEFFENLRTSEVEQLARYAMVIHMQTPSLEEGYNHDNPVRTESAEEAAKIDQKIVNVWKNHPKHYIVNSRLDFLHKTEEVVGIISKFT